MPMPRPHGSPLPVAGETDKKPVPSTTNESKRIEALLLSKKSGTTTRNHDDWSRNGSFSHHKPSYTGHL